MSTPRPPGALSPRRLGHGHLPARPTLLAVQSAVERVAQRVRAHDGLAAERQTALGEVPAGLTDIDPEVWESRDEAERILIHLRFALDLIEGLVSEFDHNARGPLTVIKGRAQLLRRRAIAMARPNTTLILGLSEIDAAVDQLVERLGGTEPGVGDLAAAPDSDPASPT